MLTVMFPGQGAQHKGMGSHLYDQHDDLFKTASEVVGYSVRQVCEQGGKQLSRTSITQVALFTVNAMYFREARNSGVKPDFLLGHSLGEFNALHAAGVFDFRTGVEIIRKRGEVMEQADSNGGMFAVLGVNRDIVETLVGDHDRIFMANVNSSEQVVVSGDLDQLNLFKSRVESKNLGSVVPLNVSGAFHSPLMQSAADQFRDFLSSYDFQPPKTPVISNVTAKEHLGNSIKDSLVQQMTSPVRWEESIKQLANRGPGIYLELGPKNVLTKLNNFILPSISSTRIL